MQAKYVNPFINVSVNLLQQICQVEASRGQVYLKQSPFTADKIVVIIGITGDIRGHVFFSMDEKTALRISSAMMFGMEVSVLDEMAKSAIAELGNMIMGNVSTELFNDGTAIDITPPSVLASTEMNVSTKGQQTLCIPIEIENTGKLEIDVVLAD
jgi:chemotaxis protein CheX